MRIQNILPAGRYVLQLSIFLMLFTLGTACYQETTLFGDTCAQSEQRTVELSWNANREKAVNSPSGGYKLNISSALTGESETIDVPYQGGDTTPTEKQIKVCPGHGSLEVTIQAYSKLNEDGSDWSAPVTVAVN